MGVSLAERVEMGVPLKSSFVAGTSTTVTSGTVSLSSCTELLSLIVSIAERLETGVFFKSSFVAGTSTSSVTAISGTVL